MFPISPQAFAPVREYSQMAGQCESVRMRGKTCSLRCGNVRVRYCVDGAAAAARSVPGQGEWRGAIGGAEGGEQPTNARNDDEVMFFP
jgi:hypothetical protein